MVTVIKAKKLEWVKLNDYQFAIDTALDFDYRIIKHDVKWSVYCNYKNEGNHRFIGGFDTISKAEKAVNDDWKIEIIRIMSKICTNVIEVQYD